MRSFLTCTANELRKLFWRPSVYIFIGVVMLFAALSVTICWLIDLSEAQTYRSSQDFYRCIQSANGLAYDLKTDFYGNEEPARDELISLLERFSADMSAHAEEFQANPADWRVEAYVNFYKRLAGLLEQEDAYYGYSQNGAIAQMFWGAIPDPADSSSLLPTAETVQAYTEEYDAIFPLISANDWRAYIQLYTLINQNQMDSGTAGEYTPQQRTDMANLMEEVVNLRLKYNIPPGPAVFGANNSDDWRNEQLSIYFETSADLVLDSGGWFDAQERSDMEAQAGQALERIEKNNKPLPESMVVYIYWNLQSMLWIICAAMAVLAGGIVAREHKTGTIKLLLTQPHRRRTLFLGKAAALAVTGALMVAAAMVAATVMFMCFEGPGTLGAAVEYTFNGTKHSLPLFLYMVQGIALALPNLVMCTLLALMLSVLLRSGALSIVFSLLCWFGSTLAQSIVRMVSEQLHVSWLRFLPFLNGNWTLYRTDFLTESLLEETGVSVTLPGQTFLFSVLVTAATVAVLFYTAYDSFTRRDIK